jgi:sulfoxide reductase heme-binding subunit YedZ
MRFSFPSRASVAAAGRLFDRPDLRFFWALASSLAVVCLLMVWHMPDVEGARMVIRITARTSLVFFSLAYVAQAAHTLWPGPQTRWLRQHRRQWGWLLVVSHTIHAIGIAAFMQMEPALFAQRTSMLTIVAGGAAFVWLWLMGATSFDRSAAWLGRKAWAKLHTWGSHYLWLNFMVANAKRIPRDTVYLAPVALLLIILGLRWWARRAASASPPALATPH